MHYAKSLVRAASLPQLRSLETRATPVNPIVSAKLVDADGQTSFASLVHPHYVIKRIEDAVAGEQKLLGQVKGLRQSLAASAAEASSSEESTTLPPSRETNALPPVALYVRGSANATRDELCDRQDRLLAKCEGRLLANDFDELGRFVQRLLERHAAGEAYTVSEICAYRGAVEELCRKDAEASLAVAINSKLPPLSAGASSALAKMVDLNTPSAVTAFLDAFAPRDSANTANETCATQLALRLRHELVRAKAAEGRDVEASAHRRDGGTAELPTGSLPSHSNHTMWTAMLESCMTNGNVDPGTVFPADPAATQRWAESLFPGSILFPAQKAEALRRIIRSRHLLPRRVTMDALSAWCLSDLEREWVSLAAFDVAHSLSDAALMPASHNACAAEHEGRPTSSHPVGRGAFQQQSLALVLKDPQRFLVNNRLLTQYADLLEQGYITVDDTSFPSFLEECGECHEGALTENAGAACHQRPRRIRFSMPAPPAGVTVHEALRKLAPFCSYWTTLLSIAESDPTLVTARVAPMNEVLVRVSLPTEHECVRVARESSWQKGQSSRVPVLYDDSHVTVYDKPAHVATSRHALSCTQLGKDVTDLVSLVMQEKQKLSDSQHSTLFRQGQIHRLDRETSGCVAFANSAAAVDSLRHQMGTSGAFSHHGKVYLALCVVLEAELNRLPLRGVLADPSDPKVRTWYRVVRFFRRSRIALLECRIQQGKKHQIRRHLAAAGLPILGDVEHGGAASCTPLIDRVALHARKLSFVHPLTAETVSVVAPVPADFQKALAELSASSHTWSTARASR